MGTQHNNKIKGVLCILFAAVGFSLMTTFVRLAGPDIPSIQKAFFRNFVALIFVSFLLIRKKISPVPGKGTFWFYFARAAFGCAGLICNFYAIDHLILADANMLNKLSPFFAIICSIFILKEKPRFYQVIGVLVAFGGALCIIKPSFSGMESFPAIMGTLGGLGAGIAYTFVRKIGQRGENGLKVIFFFSAFSSIVCLVPMLIHFTPMTLQETLCLIGAGLAACIGQFGITKAYMYAPAREISVYDYSQVIFAAILGWIVFDQIPDWLSIVGYVLICGAGIVMFLINNRKTSEA